MYERWRQPATIKAIEHDASNMILLERPLLEANVSVDKQTFERMRLGYICAKCFEPHEHPFPKVCAMPGCGFPMQAKQLEQLELDFQGELWLGPRESLADEIEQIGTRSNIVLPPGVRGT
jgi:hypothetical protein